MDLLQAGYYFIPEIRLPFLMKEFEINLVKNFIRDYMYSAKDAMPW